LLKHFNIKEPLHYNNDINCRLVELLSQLFIEFENKNYKQHTRQSYNAHHLSVAFQLGYKSWIK